MKRERRTVCYDEELNLETYHFEGIAQSFPNHFHDYYVIGLIEAGTRSLSCKNREYVVGQGDILLFHPNDNHGCTQKDEGTLDYIGINIPIDTVLSLSEEIMGKRKQLVFSQNVITDDELRMYLKSLYQMIVSGGEKFEKEERFVVFMSLLAERYGQSFENCIPECREEVETACLFMEEHYAEHISLEQLCRCTALGKSTLLRAFAKSKGITPYRYLQSLRISKGKRVVRKGDQSDRGCAANRVCGPKSFYKLFPEIYWFISCCVQRYI